MTRKSQAAEILESLQAPNCEIWAKDPNYDNSLVRTWHFHQTLPWIEIFRNINLIPELEHYNPYQDSIKRVKLKRDESIKSYLIFLFVRNNMQVNETNWKELLKDVTRKLWDFFLLSSSSPSIVECFTLLIFLSKPFSSSTFGVATWADTFPSRGS